MSVLRHRVRRRFSFSAISGVGQLSRVRFTLSGLLLSTAFGAHGWPAETGVPAYPNVAPLATTSASVNDLEQYYTEEVDPGVQQECLVCHKAGGAAPQSGARWCSAHRPR